MPAPYELALEDIVATLRRAKDRDKKATLVVGAGCSKSAGIPLADEFCTIIEKEYEPEFKRAKTRDYQQLMGALVPSERRALLAKHIDQARINWAHMGIAKLIKEGYVDRVITPNFDPLIVQACALLNLFPAVYDLATSATFKPDFVSSPAVFYIHGQRSGFRLLNTEYELTAHVERLRPVFNEASGRPWIVVGYSGDNDPMFEKLLSRQTFDSGLYWVGYRDTDPPAHLTSGFLDEARYRFYLRGEDADSFFIRVTSALDCFPPDLAHRPFTHLLSTLDMIEDYEMEQDGVHIDLLESARNMASEAVETIEKRADELEEKLTEGRSLLMSERYDDVITLVGDSKEPSLRDLAYWARVRQGLGFLNDALQHDDEERQRALFRKAVGEYASALEVKPFGYEALNNWGTVLAEQARCTEEAGAAIVLLGKAIEQYAAALKVEPNKHEVLHNWGTALLEQGKRTEEFEAAIDLFDQAIEQYAAAVRVKRDYHVALRGWGVVLAEQAARTEEDEAAIALYDRAIEQYEAAVEVKPDMHEALSNWGVVLAKQAERAEDEAVAVALFGQAAEKFAAAVEVKPDDYEALNNWGKALLAQAERAEDEAAAVALFEQAAEKFAAAVEVKPDGHGALDNWGLALLKQAARSASPDTARERTEEAAGILQRALKLNEDASAYNYACAMACLKRHEEAERWLRHSHTVGTLPSCEHIRGDSDFDGVRDSDWFVAFMDEVCSES
ncbi:MAG: hypothetical protein AAGG50_17745 [Bacteroidota bacterium]